MAGCYGNEPEDIYWSFELDKYLDEHYRDLEDEEEYEDGQDD